MKSEQVAHYLEQHPEFFEEYADLMATIFIPHPHGGRAIPISERQILTLRDKSRRLESKLKELIQFGEENDAIGEKMHRLCLALLPAGDLEALLQGLYYNLREDFAVPHAALRVWRPERSPAAVDRPEFGAVSEDLRAYAESLVHPYCGGDVRAEALSWFGDTAALLRSAACIPLHDAGKACSGMLVLASEDPARFFPEMGTLYLKRLSELLSAAIGRYL